MTRLVWPAVFAVVVGVAMIAQWAVSFAADGVPEVDTRPTALAFHLAAEGLTALLLIVAGVALLRGRPWGRWLYALATGMLVYTAIVSPGYFMQEGRPAFVGMFAVVLLLAVLGVVKVVRGGREGGGSS
jgi:peptidoglycan/LPS O-acetylase OafA/YrhL